MFYLLYLHFAYHVLAESMFQKKTQFTYTFIFWIFLAVAHALNNEAAIASDLIDKQIPPVIPKIEQPQGNDSHSK